MKFSEQTKILLEVFLESPEEDRYGYDLMKASGLKSGTLYPILSRFENEGLVTSRWTTPEEGSRDAKPRRYYRLTALGERVAHAILSQAHEELSRRQQGWVKRALLLLVPMRGATTS